MDNKKIGQLIADLRKEKSMTQKDLATLLNVTDKAVSKWERGIGYPEITILPALSDILGITPSELLTGERINNRTLEKDKANAIIFEAIEYVDVSFKKKTSSTVLSIITILFLFSSFVCLLCNFAISRNFDWSLYPTGALILVWLTITPLILAKEYKALYSLLGLSLSIIPYLFLIEYLCPIKGWVIPLALPIAGISILSLLISILLFTFLKINRFYKTAFITFLFGVILNIVFNFLVESYLKTSHNHFSNTIITLAFAFLSMLIAIIGNTKNRR